jgi:hypothetical protein
VHERRPRSRHEFEADLAEKAWGDDRFRRELQENPREVVARELGIDGLPDEIDIKVLEETPQNLYIVLPPNPGRAWGDERFGNLAVSTKWIFF